MITCTRDPITLNDVTNLGQAPLAIEGQGSGRMKIYFELMSSLRRKPEPSQAAGFRLPPPRGRQAPK